MIRGVLTAIGEAGKNLVIGKMMMEEGKVTERTRVEGLVIGEIIIWEMITVGEMITNEELAVLEIMMIGEVTTGETIVTRAITTGEMIAKGETNMNEEVIVGRMVIEEMKIEEITSGGITVVEDIIIISLVIIIEI